MLADPTASPTAPGDEDRHDDRDLIAGRHGAETGDGPTDPVFARWFLTDDERANPLTELRGFSTGNRVTPLVDGRAYFARLYAELSATRSGDSVYFLDYRGDLNERLDGPGTEVGDVLGSAARRGVGVFGLLWRSPPQLVSQPARSNAGFARRVEAAGGQVLLDGRTRPVGSHHQKLVVIQRRDQPAGAVAFVGGIDLSHSRNDDGAHLGDPQAIPFPASYGPTPPWHDLQVEVRGPAVRDLERTFRERWLGNTTVFAPTRIRGLSDTSLHLGATLRRLPRPLPEDDDRPGSQAVQVLRTYPARLRGYRFAPRGERSIAHAYQKAFARARSLVYLEDQYVWSRPVAKVIAAALRANPELRVIAVVPRHSDYDGIISRAPGAMARVDALRICAAAGGDRFTVYDLENEAGTPIYVHSKVVIVDDVWAIVGSDNLNRRSWTHDSELSVAVVDAARDPRAPLDPGGCGDGARTFARDLRLRLSGEHLGRAGGDVADLLEPAGATAAFTRQARELAAWRTRGGHGSRPPGRVRVHEPEQIAPAQRLWATPLYRWIYDPDGRSWHDRLRGRL